MQATRTFALLALATVAHCTFAQRPSSFETRQATGMGPYPIFIGLQYVGWTNSIREFERFADSPNFVGKFKGAGGRVLMDGFNVKAGFIMTPRIQDKYMGRSVRNWKRRIPFPNLCVELDYQNLGESFKGTPTGLMQMREEFFVVRPIGVRYNIFYPLTIQYTFGLVLVHAVAASVNYSDTLELARTVRLSGTMFEKGDNRIFGFENRARLTFFDPVGSAGGLGLYVEGQWTLMTRDVPLNKLYALTKDAAERKASFSYITWSIGLTVPLAMRIK